MNSKDDAYLTPGEIIARRCDAQFEEQARFDWTPSPEHDAFPVWVVEEVKKQHGGRFEAHPPYTDTGIELLDALGLWPWPERMIEPWDDQPNDRWSERIHAAHPSRTGTHDAYAMAMRMVSTRRSKYAIVMLVHWLLTRQGLRPSDVR